ADGRLAVAALAHPAHELRDVLPLDAAEPAGTELRLDVTVPSLPVERNASLGSPSGGGERVEKREVVALGELGERHGFADDALALVARGEEDAALALRGALGSGFEHDGPQVAVGVAEVAVEPSLARLGASPVEVGCDPLARAGAV